MIVYVVITEEFYGGNDKIKVFSCKEDAHKYVKDLEDMYNLDVIVRKYDI